MKNSLPKLTLVFLALMPVTIAAQDGFYELLYVAKINAADSQAEMSLELKQPRNQGCANRTLDDLVRTLVSEGEVSNARFNQLAEEMAGGRIRALDLP